MTELIVQHDLREKMQDRRHYNFIWFGFGSALVGFTRVLGTANIVWHASSFYSGCAQPNGDAACRFIDFIV